MSILIYDKPNTFTVPLRAGEFFTLVPGKNVLDSKRSAQWEAVKKLGLRSVKLRLANGTIKEMTAKPNDDISRLPPEDAVKIIENTFDEKELEAYAAQAREDKPLLNVIKKQAKKLAEFEAKRKNEDEKK